MWQEQAQPELQTGQDEGQVGGAGKQTSSGTTFSQGTRKQGVALSFSVFMGRLLRCVSALLRSLAG